MPGSNFDDTVAVAKRLHNEGFVPIPHFAARSIPNKTFLENGLERLRDEANVSRVLLIGGAVPTPVGDFSDSMQLLDTGLFDKFGIRSIGLAGHPEGSPDMSDEAIREALQWKNQFSHRTDAHMYLVTQFCFEAAPSFNGINVFSQKATNCQSTSAFLAWRPSKHCWRTPKPAELAHQ